MSRPTANVSGMRVATAGMLSTIAEVIPASQMSPNVVKVGSPLVSSTARSATLSSSPISVIPPIRTNRPMKKKIVVHSISESTSCKSTLLRSSNNTAPNIATVPIS